MAPPRAARSASRQNTPLSPPKGAAPAASSRQQASGRSTRSRSRDIQASTESSLSSEEQSQVNRRRLRKEGTEAAPEARLDAVPEAPEVAQSDLGQDDALETLSAGGDNAEMDDSDDSSVADSRITSYTQYELSELDRDSMIDALPLLYQYSESLIAFFTSSDGMQFERLHHDLQQPDSKARRRLATLMDGFRLNRKQFGNESPIDVDLAAGVMSGLRRAGRPLEGQARSDLVLHLANIAECLSLMSTSERESDNVREMLEKVFNTFPTPFGELFDGSFDHPQYNAPETLVDSALSLVLEIRTQYLLSKLTERRDDPAFDPDVLLRSIFYVDHEHLRGIDPLDEVSLLPSHLRDPFRERVAEIRQHFSIDVNGPVDFIALNAQYPYSAFLFRLTQWMQSMAEELRETITEQGGVGQIQAQLHNAVESGQSEEFTTPTAEMFVEAAVVPEDQVEHREALVRPPSTEDPVTVPDSEELLTPRASIPHKRKRKLRKSEAERYLLQPKSIQQLKSAREALESTRKEKAAKSAVKMVRPGEEAPYHDDVQPLGNDDPILQSPPRTQGNIVPSQQGQIVLDILKRQALQSNKENNPNVARAGKLAFIDRQPNAVRISFDSQDDPVAEESQSRASAKRKLENGEDDDEDDFEVDDRPMQRKSLRAVAHKPNQSGASSKSAGAISNREASTRSPPKRARLIDDRNNVLDEDDDDFEDGDDYNNAARRQLQSGFAEESRHQRHSASSIPATRRSPHQERRNVRQPVPGPVDDGSAPPLGTLLATVKERAKQTVQRHAPKPSQSRTAWTEEEVERFITLIAEHGTSWRYLKEKDEEHEDGPLLSERDQVALKDKARNIKMDFLKAGATMPQNFDRIKLGPRLLNMLQARGVYHDGS